MARRFGVDPEVLKRLNVKIKDAPSPITEDEMKEARTVKLGPAKKRNRHRICLTLDPLTVSLARKISNGNISRGIDRAVLHFTECDRPVKKPGPKNGRDLRHMR